MNRTRKLAALGATAALVLTGSFVGISAAQAHDKKVDLTCTAISVSLTNYPGGSTVGGKLDGIDLGTSNFGPGPFNFSQALDPAVPHDYTIVVTSGDGNKQFNFTESGKSDPSCIPVVTPPTEEPTPPVTTPPVTPPTEEPTPPVTTPPVEPPIETPKPTETPAPTPTKTPDAPKPAEKPVEVQVEVVAPPAGTIAPIATPVESNAHFTG